MSDIRPPDYKLAQSCHCTTCQWAGKRRELIWSRPRGYICPKCFETTIEIETEETATMSNEFEQPILDTTDRTDILVWWLGQEECEAIGDYPPGSVPLYIRNEYLSRYGRNGRGRLWVASELGKVGIPWDESKPAARLAAERGGIVIYKTDAHHVFNLPGFLTDLHLNFISALED